MGSPHSRRQPRRGFLESEEDCGSLQFLSSILVVLGGSESSRALCSKWPAYKQGDKCLVLEKICYCVSPHVLSPLIYS